MNADLIFMYYHNPFIFSSLLAVFLLNYEIYLCFVFIY